MNTKPTYIFVDGGYLRRQHANVTQSWFGLEPNLDFRLVIRKLEQLADPRDVWFPSETVLQPPERETRSFYYDCPDEGKKDKETDEQYKSRIERQDAQLRELREVDGCHLRLGTLKGDKNKRKQKEVDVLLAVDMLAHAARGNMTKAVLLAGDLDFRPAVEALVQLGVFVQIVADEKTTSKELTWAGSAFSKLSFDDFYNWSSSDLKSRYPIPQSGSYKPYSRSEKAIKEGCLNGYRCTLFESENHFLLHFKCFDPLHVGGKSEWHFMHEDLARLELYLKLQHGPVVWDN